MFSLDEKHQIMPFVTLYKNAIKNPKDFLEIIKSSEGQINSDDSMYSWSAWDNFGIKANLHDIHMQSDKDLHPGKNVLDEFNNLINAGLDEYIKYWILDDNASAYKTTNPEHWKNIFPEFVKNWNYKTDLVDLKEDFESCETVMVATGNPGWIRSGIDILKHKENTVDRFAIGYHIDTDGSLDTPGPKTILTATIYINDDYEGGGVSYLNEFDGTVVNYKPSAGDLVIFPSSKPFFHAALPLSGDKPKYLARKFLRWKSTGSLDWENEIEKNGEDFTLKLYTERRKIESAMGYYTKRVFLKDEDRSTQEQHGDPFFVKDIIDFNKKIEGGL
jgi:hypothetical protein